MDDEKDPPTPPPPPPPAPEPTPDPPPTNDPAPDRISVLEQRMNDAEATLAALLQTPDSNPSGKPWTHKKVF